MEQYAADGFPAGLLRKGESDPAAIERRSARVAALTGLDPALVRRYHGMLDNDVFLHELDRAAGRVGSGYDATITTADPFPLSTSSYYPDPVLEGLKAPVSSAMVAIYETQLNWRPDVPIGSKARRRATNGTGATACSAGRSRWARCATRWRLIRICTC